MMEAPARRVVEKPLEKLTGGGGFAPGAIGDLGQESGKAPLLVDEEIDCPPGLGLAEGCDGLGLDTVLGRP